MMKTILSAAAMSALLLAAPVAYADCAADMKATQTMMDTATDATKKEMAMKEMAMAKDMMTKKDEAGCMTHTDAAMKAMK